jgi:hypothetical protein
MKKMKNNILVRNYRRSAIIPFFITQVLFFCGQGVTITQEIETITIKDLRQHMDSIASDATEGRFIGSPGYRKAAQYTANVFREAGLNPGYTDEKGEKSFFQPVPFIRYYYSPATSITIRKNGKDKTFDHSAGNFVILNPGTQNKSIQMTSPAFIGYGVNEPELGWDDYAGVDVKGRWVIVLNGIPAADSMNPSFPDTLRKQYTDWKTRDSLKLNALIKHKAAGVIVLPDKYAIENWESTVIRNYMFNYIHYAEAEINRKVSPEPVIPFILLQAEPAQLLLAEQSYDPMSHKGSYHPYILDNTEISVTIDCKKEFIDCYNVIAVVSGTDSALRKEYITVGAHLDHLGKIGNHVYNGANDDASGCVIILEAAKALALNPPKRSVLCVLYTAEELSLIGSMHFVKNPPVPIGQISLNINIEQIGSKNRDYKGVWAIGSPQFKESFFKAGNSFVEVDFKFDPIESYLEALRGHVDLWSYYQKNIPAIMLSSGGFKDHHTPQDKIDLIDFDHLQFAAKLLYSFIIELGNEQHSSDTNKTNKKVN